MLFDTSLINTGNIITDPGLSVQEIIDYQNILEVSFNQIENIKKLNDKLRALNPASAAFNDEKQNIQNQLAGYLESNISYKDYQYKLLDKNETSIGVGTDYILNGDQFFNCFGNKKNVREASGHVFSESDLAKFSDPNNNYFGVDTKAEYTTAQDNTQRMYPGRQDLEMELKNLEQIPPGGNAPVSVINQYLTAINGFYERQMANMLGPRTHNMNQILDFDNNTLDTKEKTFFVYETDPNNTYECQPGITGVADFSYCGPTAYYQDLKF